MKSINYERLAFISVTVFTFVLCIYGATLGISYDEAKLFFAGHGAPFYLAKTTMLAFGQNDFALRLPFIIIHSISAFIFWEISKIVCKKEVDAYISLLIFILMPGLNIVALLANKSGLLLFAALLTTFLILKQRFILASIVMIIGAFSDNGYATLLIGIAAWGFSDRKYKFGALAGVLFLICMVRFGFNDGGMPQGWFLETIGAYFALFSPFVFIFYLYALFKLRKNPSLLWQITFWGIALSLVLSLRQRVPLIDFAPYSIFAVPLAVGFFAREWRTKLPEFRLKYKVMGIITFASLLLWSAASFFMQASLFVVSKPELCPLWPHMAAKELSNELKGQNIYAINANGDDELQTRLKWYGIEKSEDYNLSKSGGKVELPIYYGNKLIKKYYLE
ncbi:MAG: hypothetical protein RL154_1118 [Pseudomonadota bacterium]|jgi:hypothetical protein